MTLDYPDRPGGPTVRLRFPLAQGHCHLAPIVVAGKAPLLADEAPVAVRAFLDGATRRSTFSAARC